MSALGAPSVQKQMVARKQTAHGRSILLLQGQSMPCCSNGIVTGIEKAGISLTIQHCKAASLSGGAAMNAPRARCTAGKLGLSLET